MVGSRVGLPLLLGTTAGLFLLLAGVLTLALWDTLVRAIIASKVVLSPGSEVAAAWAEPPVTPLLRVYYFNVTNPQVNSENGTAPSALSVQCAEKKGGGNLLC